MMIREALEALDSGLPTSDNIIFIFLNGCIHIHTNTNIVPAKANEIAKERQPDALQAIEDRK